MLCRFLFYIQNTFFLFQLSQGIYLKNISIFTKKKTDLLKNSILQKPTLKFNKNLEKGGNFGRCKKRNEEQWRSKVTIKLPGILWVDLKYNIFLDIAEHFPQNLKKGLYLV